MYVQRDVCGTVVLFYAFIFFKLLLFIFILLCIPYVGYPGKLRPTFANLKILAFNLTWKLFLTTFVDTFLFLFLFHFQLPPLVFETNVRPYFPIISIHFLLIFSLGDANVVFHFATKVCTTTGQMPNDVAQLNWQNIHLRSHTKWIKGSTQNWTTKEEKQTHSNLVSVCRNKIETR